MGEIFSEENCRVAGSVFETRELGDDEFVDFFAQIFDVFEGSIAESSLAELKENSGLDCRRGFAL